MKASARDTFAAALDALVPQLQQDRSILAAILGGSLSHDKVWAKSDIDLLLVTVDDTLAGPPHVSLYADGLNVHALLMQRSAFRKLAEGAAHQSFMHSFLAKGRLLYTHDETIADLFATLQKMGDRDRELALFAAATELLHAATRDVDAEISGRVVAGLAVEELVELSAGVDLVVVGSRGWGPVRRILAGSTSVGLMREAHCPVIVLPRGAATGEPGEHEPRRSQIEATTGA